MEDTDYIFKYMNITRFISGLEDSQCNWFMRTTLLRDLVYKVELSRNQTSELEPRFGISSSRIPSGRVPLDHRTQYPWTKVLFEVDTRVSLAICKREDIVVARGKILPDTSNAPLFLSGDAITVMCDEGHFMELGLKSVVITCTASTRQAVTCSGDTKGPTVIVAILVAMVVFVLVLVVLMLGWGVAVGRCSEGQTQEAPEGAQGEAPGSEGLQEAVPDKIQDNIEDPVQDNIREDNIREDNLSILIVNAGIPEIVSTQNQA